MANIKKFGVRGLRSFGYNEQLIPFSRINIYVGKNSCGKSSFLRTFPLLRQSTEADTTSPILWYAGHEGYVDFGDFGTALHDGGEKIHFDFEINIPQDDRQRITRKFLNQTYRYSYPRHIVSNKEFTINVSLSLQKEKNSVKNTVIVSEGENATTIVYTGDEISSLTAENNKWQKQISVTTPLKISRGSLIPVDGFTLKEISVKSYGKAFTAEEQIPDDADQAFANFIAQYHHASKKTKNIKSALENIPICSGEQLYRHLRNAFSGDKFFRRKLEEHKERIVEISYTHLFLKYTSFFLSSADELFKQFYGGVRYLGPIRASAERFYRFQDLQIGEIDHTGSNLPMVINSLGKAKKNKLSKWVKESFGFELELESTGTHYALLIKEEGDSRYHNVSDMGFGYSQILPVIVSIWLEIEDKEDSDAIIASNYWHPKIKQSKTIVIEQPELHLHPALQYKFGSAIAKVINIADQLDYNFIIETHSKHLIDAIGEGISQGIVKESQINVALFEKNSSGVTEVSLAGFDKEGYLVNWPTGFLSA